MCSDHAALRQVGDVCMQPVCDADSDVMIVYQDNIGACLRRINMGYSLMNILYYIHLKLVRTNISYHFTLPPYFHYLSLCAPITSDECHA